MVDNILNFLSIKQTSKFTNKDKKKINIIHAIMGQWHDKIPNPPPIFFTPLQKGTGLTPFQSVKKAQYIVVFNELKTQWLVCWNSASPVPSTL